MAVNKNKLMDAARKAVEKGQVDRAIKEYLKVVSEDPDDVRVWLKIGDLYAKRGSKQEATDTYLKVAKFYSEQGFYLKAVAVFKQILKLDPRLVEVNLKLAELYRQLGLLSDAMQHFEMVAAFFHREGKTKEALATIRQLVDLDPENVATRIKLAELYSKEGLVEEASSEFGHACDYLRKHNRQDDFIKVAERLLWHKPENIALSRELASLYLRRNDARRALQKLQICFKADPRDVETLALLAQAFQALEQKGKTVSVLKELARILSENGQRAQAEEVHRKILMYVPDDPDSLAAVGRSARPPDPSEEIDLSASDVIEDELPQRIKRSPVGSKTGSMPLVNPADLRDYGSMDSGVEPGDEARQPSFADGFDSPSSPGFMASLSLDEESSFDADSSVGGEAHADEIVKILTETDVYVKYALHQKAIEHLRRVFELDPDNVEARLRLKEILLSQGREDDAVGELLKLAEQTASHDREGAERYLREVLTIDPDRAEAFDLADRFRLNVRGDGRVEVVDDLADAIEVEVASSEIGAAGADDELEFDDLDFDRAAAQGQEDTGAHNYDRADSEFEFEVQAPGGYPPPLDYEATSQPLERDGAGTMEVDLDQVEEAVPDDAEELRFDRPAGLIAGGQEDLDSIDLNDARAFDASLPSGVSEDTVDGEDDAGVLAAQPIGFDGGFDLIDGAHDTTPPPIAMDHAPPTAAPHDPTHQIAVADPGGTEEDELPGDAGAASSLEDDLDEADFFIAQGLLSEARDILEGLLARYPHHPLVMPKLRDVEAMISGSEGEEAAAATPEPVLDVLDESRAKPAVMLEKPVDDDDADTHYDLGLAYKEMALYDEAIKAFHKVLARTGREVQCHLMIGLCYREQGNVSEAINQFKAGLYVDTISPAEKFDLYYEIGNCYEALNDPQEARSYYELVLKKDAKYRDVAARVTALRARSGGGASSSHADV